VSKGQQIANEFELALERGTEWWDILILLLTYCQLPSYTGYYHIIIHTLFLYSLHLSLSLSLSLSLIFFFCF
jgi:hypothetical protein